MSYDRSYDTGYRSSDQDLRSAQRRYLSDTGDTDARDRLMRLERRLNLVPAQFEVEQFAERLRDAAVANELNPVRGEFPPMATHLLTLVANRQTRDRLRWAWFRLTIVQWRTSPPLVMTVRKGDTVTFAIGRSPTGDNILAPQLVWPELGPNWFPGAHEHGALPPGVPSGHEYRASWDESDIDDRTGVCRSCGDNPKDVRVANERPGFEKKLDEFAFGKQDPYTTRPASTRLVSASIAVVRTHLERPVSVP